MNEISMEELINRNNPVIIDIRSPIEFKDGAIPGAINIPLFTDEERQEIGTIYKQEGSDKAKWRAMELVSPKIPFLLKEIKDTSANSNQKPIIHCWRGGMRSKSVVTFLEFAGIRANLLTGGYKAYRQYILSKIPDMLPERAIVLHGLTGVGKTEILKLLAKKGFPIIDLEGIAGHRGSIFGTIGLEGGNNQKTFDSLLFKRLKELNGSSYFLMEAESKRIGKALQPDELFNKKIKGIHFYIHTSMDQRVSHIVNEYVTPFEHLPWYFNEINEGIEKVLRRVKDNEIRKALMENLESHNYSVMIKVLLESYYDPKYDHKRQEYEGDFFDIFAESHQEAAEKIADQLLSISLSPQYI